MTKPKALSILRREFGDAVKVDRKWRPGSPRLGVVLNGFPALGENWREVVATARRVWAPVPR